jgi:hypothetical protein
MAIERRAALAIALAAVSTYASAAPVAFEGRYYEVVAASGISWNDANAAANARTHLGVHGHLATINTAAEDTFVDSLNVPPGNRTELWIGGFQETCTPEPGCGWKWVNNELISAVDDDDPYTNWATGQPDNQQSSKSLAIGLNGWTDGKASEIWGYVVEYGETLAPFSAGLCAATTAIGCNLTRGPGDDGVVIKLPASAIVEVGDQYTVRTWIVDDDSCGTARELDLLVDPDHPGPEVIVPAYLCAHPDLDYFLVVKSQAPIEIPSGVVSISNDTKKLLPTAYDCNLPIPKNVNPTLQDIVVFQYDKKEDMIESITTTGPYFGTTTEATNGCINPSRGSGPKGSWHLVGLHIDAGSASAYQALLELTKFKLQMLAEAVAQAGVDGAVGGGDLTKLGNEAKTALGDITKGNLNEALKHVVNFQKFAKAAVYTTTSDTNWNGEFLMRGDNIAFMLNVKLIPFKPK